MRAVRLHAAPGKLTGAELLLQLQHASPSEYEPLFDTIRLFKVNEYWARLLVSEEAADPSNRLPAGPRLPAALKKGEELPLLPLPPGVASAELSRKLSARRRRCRGGPETPNGNFVLTSAHPSALHAQISARSISVEPSPGPGGKHKHHSKGRSTICTGLLTPRKANIAQAYV